MSQLTPIFDQLQERLHALKFADPVAYVYNPLEYAREPWNLYLKKYGKGPKEALFLGMNPGPWGMAQTGIPFGEVTLVRDWLGVEAPVGQPQKMHPKKPVDGFSCKRSEVSGKRLWGWAQEQFKTPEAFFKRFLVINYCPLLFLHESGRNLTPEVMPRLQQQQISEICGEALAQTVEVLKPKYLIGVGRYAEKQAQEVLTGFTGTIAYISHPSPANPKSNKGWPALVAQELSDIGLQL